MKETRNKRVAFECERREQTKEKEKEKAIDWIGDAHALFSFIHNDYRSRYTCLTMKKYASD